jgi:hypothetical protein
VAHTLGLTHAKRLLFLVPAAAPALALAPTHQPSASHSDPVTAVVIALAVILTAAKLGGHLAAQVGQPAVLGELVAGVVLAALTSRASLGSSASRATRRSKSWPGSAS